MAVSQEVNLAVGMSFTSDLIPKKIVEFEQTKFDEGSFREAYMGTWVKPDDKRGQKCVVKRTKGGDNILGLTPSNKTHVTILIVQKAQQLAKGFNEFSSTTTVSFEDVHEVYDMKTMVSKPMLVTVENYLEGEYRKWCNNFGYISPAAASTDITMPAFMHWSWVHNKGELMIGDLQGVRNGKHYSLTDPAIMSLNEIFGETDTGVQGMLMFFRNHKCNDICKGLLMPNASDVNQAILQMAQQQPNRHTTYKWQLNQLNELLKMSITEAFKGYFVKRGPFARPRLRHNELPD